MKKLEPQEVSKLLQELPLWTLNAQGDAISREYLLADFVQAFAFMTQIAITAEKHNHHPEWRNVYHRVHITWTTHDVDGLSVNDMVMAQVCDQAFAGYHAPTAIPAAQ
jgi:4a-hydroxytetrahydrobiopterin dehydratase